MAVSNMVMLLSHACIVTAFALAYAAHEYARTHTHTHAHTHTVTGKLTVVIPYIRKFLMVKTFVFKKFCQKFFFSLIIDK